MPGRRLKVFRAHLGFYDTVVAAPSQKAALEAWGAGRLEFAKGFASVTNDPVAVECALRSPGVVLKRPFGTGGPFKAEPAPIPEPKVSLAQRKHVLEAERRRKQVEQDKQRNEAAALKRRAREAVDKLRELARRQTELERERKDVLAQAARLKVERKTRKRIRRT